MTTTADPTPALRDELTAALVDRGVLASPAWQRAFRAVPRHHFVPRFAVPGPNGPVRYDIAGPDLAAQSSALRHAYADTALVTAFDTEVSPAPSATAVMLEALDARPGHAVLEVGAGTGYRTALLSHALGEEAVTTVDPDGERVDRVRAALCLAGYRPTVVCAAEAAGHPARAPYDRIIAGRPVDRVPAAWLGQVRAGGAILAGLAGRLLLLRVAADHSAIGRFRDGLPGQAAVPDAEGAVARRVIALCAGEPAACRTTAWPAALDEPTVAFLQRVTLPEVHRVVLTEPDGPAYLFADLASGSWCRVGRRSGRTVWVAERGPRPLWSEVTALADGYERTGRPRVHRYGLCVTASGEHMLWLDSPSQPVRHI
ncbi:methyltransferase [Gandjariella thermophila]|uniref:Protein-L-isoaspartate O-methyltransferase n=1 Tax=Gandjariella thermophila TaxID=1931992 RepID=A0A4D4JBZ5_9PSEU|nr:methyltransferase [Gandjariella thermophila]GDY31437.1 protein-L-isoaspartate O-methyltransferase [Gandjariella thermophila]